MKKILSRLLLIGCLATALSARLNAASIPLAFGNADPYAVGFVVDGVGNPDVQASYVNILVGLAANTTNLQVPIPGGEFYTRTDNFGALPQTSDTGALKQDNANTTFDLGVGGFTYLIGKYDAENAGMYVWYVAGLTGTVTMPANSAGFNGDQGLSHSIAYGPGATVPDGGSTIALLGGALMLLAGVYRRGFSIALS
jgi:hypothetical protein